MTRILSLDDDSEMLKLLGLILELAGYEHLRTTNSHEALSLLRGEPIDLFTQDCLRPDIDCLEFYQLMKSDVSLRTIPVLFISAGSRPEIAAECRATYGDDYLVKPFSPPELLATVAGLLRRHSKHVPTEAERAARYEAVRAKLKSEMNWSGEWLDRFCERIDGWFKEMSKGS